MPVYEGGGSKGLVWAISRSLGSTKGLIGSHGDMVGRARQCLLSNAKSKLKGKEKEERSEEKRCLDLVGVIGGDSQRCAYTCGKVPRILGRCVGLWFRKSNGNHKHD